MIVVTSEGLVRVDDRKSRGAGGDCESDSNKYEDFFHGRILSKGSLNYITATRAATTSGHTTTILTTSDITTSCDGHDHNGQRAHRPAVNYQFH